MTVDDGGAETRTHGPRNGGGQRECVFRAGLSTRVCGGPPRRSIRHAVLRIVTRRVSPATKSTPPVVPIYVYNIFSGYTDNVRG